MPTTSALTNETPESLVGLTLCKSVPLRSHSRKTAFARSHTETRSLPTSTGCGSPTSPGPPPVCPRRRTSLPVESTRAMRSAEEPAELTKRTCPCGPTAIGVSRLMGDRSMSVVVKACRSFGIPGVWPPSGGMEATAKRQAILTLRIMMASNESNASWRSNALRFCGEASRGRRHP